MKYKITFTNYAQKELIVSREAGIELMRQRTSITPIKYVEVLGGQYSLKSIKDIEPVYDVASGGLRITERSPGTCKGQHSIQYKIMQGYMSLSKPRQPYKEYSSSAYDFLYDKKSEWCDYKKNTCVCDKDYVPQTAPSKELVDKVFGPANEMLV